jgi:NADH:ubiquinone oxidoreductase subunit 5 (subunit L)/multisubunit Na+/H+ antiporter MnhA subunit
MMSSGLRLLPLIILLLSGGCGIIAKTFQLAKYGAIAACVLFIVASSSGSSVGATATLSLFKIGKISFGLSFCFGEVETIVCAVVSAILCCLYSARSIELIDKHVDRKFGILNVFVCFMCVAIFSKNLFQFYVAVEALGVISATIVGMEKRATYQATRVFAFNKFASLLFLMALIMIARSAGSLEFADIEALYSNGNASSLFWPSALLLGACLCKGAQVPFSYWLVDAAKANTFASILIHSGTSLASGLSSSRSSTSCSAHSSHCSGRWCYLGFAHLC